LNLNMKAPMEAFRKFHGKELDLKESCKSDSTKGIYASPQNLS
jgi:hypothetical protein